MGEIEEYIGIQILGLAYICFIGLIIAVWIYFGLYEIIGLLFSIIILVLIFVSLPIVIYLYYNKKKSKEKKEIIDIEDKLISKQLRKKWKKR